MKINSNRQSLFQLASLQPQKHIQPSRNPSMPSTQNLQSTLEKTSLHTRTPSPSRKKFQSKLVNGDDRAHSTQLEQLTKGSYPREHKSRNSPRIGRPRGDPHARSCASAANGSATISLSSDSLLPGARGGPRQPRLQYRSPRGFGGRFGLELFRRGAYVAGGPTRRSGTRRRA